MDLRLEKVEDLAKEVQDWYYINITKTYNFSISGKRRLLNFSEWVHNLKIKDNDRLQ